MNRPAEPATLADIQLVHSWTTTNHQNPLPFVIYDGADVALVHLASADTWFMAPLFKQVYVIRAKLDDGSVSCVYAFLSGKEQRM